MNESAAAVSIHAEDGASAGAASLIHAYRRYAAEGSSDPFANPVTRLALDIADRLREGQTTAQAVDAVVRHLTVSAFRHRALRLGRYLGESDPAANRDGLRAAFEALAHDGEAVAPFATFAARVERESYGVVLTAHPTFGLPAELMRGLARLATDRDDTGDPLGEAGRQAELARAAAAEHRPETLTLEREHELSLIALVNLREAMRAMFEAAFTVAEAHYPDRWTELTPRLITVASWVGYDLDGRSDIEWTDTLHKRLKVERLQLDHYLAEARAIRTAAATDERRADYQPALDLLISRLALSIREVEEEIAVFGESDLTTTAALAAIERISRRMVQGQELRLTDAREMTEVLAGAIARADAAEVRRRLAVLRAEMANFGLGIAHTHVRLNATQINNAVRRAVGLRSAVDDPRFRKSYIEQIGELLDTVEPVTVNFGSIVTERASARRLIMVIAQMLKLVDRTTPVRFLIAECETAFTPLAALYLARLFAVDDRIDISPLFETQKALENGSRIVDQLLENPHYRAYVRKRGRLCVQTGFSDAGRYLGQPPASASIERLRHRLGRVMAKHALDGVQLVIFDTHGESIGRGGHPRSFADRLSYCATPASRALFAELGIDAKEESSFQGGDGYIPFFTAAAALASLTRIVTFFTAPPETGPADPFYEDPDFIREFFTMVTEFQNRLMNDPDYGAFLSAFGPSLLYQTGSRPVKRQREGAAEAGRRQEAHEFRAIPHNAVLQQLGLLANSISGMGQAIDRDPDRFHLLYETSPRLRQLIGIVEYALAVGDVDATKGYVDSYDPGFWLLRASRLADESQAAEQRDIASVLEAGATHARLIRLFRTLFRDYSVLRAGLARATGGDRGCGTLVAREVEVEIAVLHALRLAVVWEIFQIATRIPDFAPQLGTSRELVMERIFALEIPEAVETLRKVFPITQPGEQARLGDFGEPASYASDASQGYLPEHRTILEPMLELYHVALRIGAAVTHNIGFVG